MRGFHRGPVNSPHKWPVTRKRSHLMTSSWSVFMQLSYCVTVSKWGSKWMLLTIWGSLAKSMCLVTTMKQTKKIHKNKSKQIKIKQTILKRSEPVGSFIFSGSSCYTERPSDDSFNLVWKLFIRHWQCSNSRESIWWNNTKFLFPSDIQKYIIIVLCFIRINIGKNHRGSIQI